MDLGVQSTSLADIISAATNTSTISPLVNNSSSIKGAKTKNNHSKTTNSTQKKNNENENTCNVDFSNFLTIYSLNVGLVPSVPSSIHEQLQMWIPTRSGLWMKVLYLFYFQQIYFLFFLLKFNE